MTEQYTQIINVLSGKRGKVLKAVAASAAAAGVICVLLSAFINMFFMIPFCVFLVIGAVVMQIYGSSAKEFEYDYNALRLIVARKNQFGQTKRIAEITTSTVTGFDICGEDKNDAISAIGEDREIFKLAFNTEHGEKVLYFCPDNYLRELITESLNARKEDLQL